VIEWIERPTDAGRSPCFLQKQGTYKMRFLCDAISN